MGYVLRHHVYGCIADERVALLDLMANRYFCAPPKMESTIKALVDKTNGTGDFDALRPLLARGLMIEVRDPGLSLTDITLSKPTASVFDCVKSAGSVGCSARSISTRLATAAALKVRPVHKVIDRISARKSAIDKVEAFSEADMSAMARSFIASRRIVSKQDKCLAWSLSMVHYLSRFQFYPNFVIGVKMNPFAAHAWVQHGDVVLSDTVESVRPFTPIMIA